MKRFPITLLLCIASFGAPTLRCVDSDTEEAQATAQINDNDDKVQLPNGTVTTKHDLSNVLRCLQLLKTPQPTIFAALAEYADLSRNKTANMSIINLRLCQQYSLDITDFVVLGTVHACLQRGTDGQYSVVDPLRRMGTSSASVQIHPGPLSYQDAR